MKRQIRFGVFETNSSSTHSLTMCSEEEYNKWERGDLLLNDNWSCKKGKFVTKEVALDHIRTSGYMDEYEEEVLLRDSEFYTYDSYFDDSLESYDGKYVTPRGETVVAFGKYGHD